MLTTYRPHSSPLSFNFEARLSHQQLIVDSEVDQIMKLVKEAGRDIERFNSEILWLRQRAKGLELERKAFEEHAASARSLLSPIRRLPLELLVDIFSYCCADSVIMNHSLGTAGAVVSIDVPTITLGQVCRSWQSIISSNPSLWSSFST